ncbi:MAG: hypothetical protein R3C17_01495 [Planctomycetaceae bacterium]
MSQARIFLSRLWVWLAVPIWLTLTTLSPAGRAVADQIDGPPMMMLSAELEDTEQKNDAGKPIDACTWVREIFRQHILMVAREEFGFVTRDVTLGEPVDRDSPECFHLKVLAWEDAPVQLTLRRGDTVIYEGTVVNEECHVLKKFRHLPKHVLDTRESLVKSLNAAGYEQTPLPKGKLPVLPAEVETLLGRMNTISQYAAVRRLHQLLEEHGESPVILGGLARGYAHLSQLSLPLLDLRHRAFGARSLLYANRLGRLEPDSAVGYWHRAYAFTFLGYPLAAHKELNAATKKARQNPPEPQWLKLIPLYVGYRFKEFEQLVEDENYEFREAAALLWFMASRMSVSPAFTIETGVKVRKVMPNSQRVIAGLFDTAGVAMNHQLSVEGAPALLATIYENLKEITDLPAAISAELDLKDSEDQNETDREALLLRPNSLSLLEDSTRLLRLAGDDDPSEPSFYVLESTLRAWNLQHLCQRAQFLRGYLGVDAGNFVAATQTSVKDDPFGPLYAAMGFSNYAPVEVASELIREIPHVELNYCSVGYDFINVLPRTARTKNGTVNDYLTRSWRDAGNFEETIRKRINGYFGAESRGERLQQARWLNNVSLDSPMSYSEQVLLDWANVADKAEQWGIQFPGYPGLHFALARACKSFGNVDRAIEHYNHYLAMIQDARGYIGLAEAMYMKDRESSEWMSVLEKSMECEDYFLTHSQAAQEAASTLMHDGRYEEALPWAERAAESGSGSGLQSLVEALTGTADFERAESICIQTSQRYQSDDWYQWCVATGEGDLESAWEFEQERLKVRYAPGDSQSEMVKALYAEITNDTARALKILLRMAKNRPPSEPPYVWTDSMAYLIADRAGDQKICNQILKSYRDQREPPLQVQAITAMLNLFDESDRSKAIDPMKIQALIDGHVAFSDGAYLPDLALFVGYFEWTHGHKDAAIEQWKGPARLSGGRDRMLAWKWLREAGVDPIHIEDRTFPDMFLRERYELPKKKE